MKRAAAATGIFRDNYVNIMVDNDPTISIFRRLFLFYYIPFKFVYEGILWLQSV